VDRWDFLAFDSEARRLFISRETHVSVLDVDREKIVGDIPDTQGVHGIALAPELGRGFLAIDRRHRRLFAGCGNRVVAVIDADSGGVVASPAIGDGVDANAFDPVTQLASSSNGDGTLTVVREDAANRFTVVENVPTRRGAKTMVLDEKGTTCIS
jgi:hypothetical protein